MKAIYRYGFCVIIMTAAVLAAIGLFSRDISAAQAQTADKASAQAKPAPVKKLDAAAQAGLVARGEDLVDHVAMCTECHTPRDANNNLDNSRYLRGASTWIMPVHIMTNWAWRAPAIAGLVGFSDDQAETVLEKGVGPNGLEIHPPMHIYHMNRADAQAVIAYLRSLPSNFPQ